MSQHCIRQQKYSPISASSQSKQVIQLAHIAHHAERYCGVPPKKFIIRKLGLYMIKIYI